MDHAEALELLELAAAEPGGFERLMAGDTPAAAALAGHLAGCPECAAEMTRIRRSGQVIAAFVRSTPAPELRERTLAYVAAVGRDRSTGTAGAPGEVVATEASAPPPAAGSDDPSGAPEPRRLAARIRPATPARLAALAATLILAVAGTALLLGAGREAALAARDAELARRAAVIAALERVVASTLRITAESGARHVALSSPEGIAAGRLVFSPDTTDLVVTATGLPRPPEGREFRCWVEVDGRRHRIGRMFFADDLAFWVGPVEAVGTLPPGARFGVSLVDAAGESLEGPPVLVGRL